MSDLSKFRVVLKTPHTWQLVFLRSKAKRKVVRAGRRAGKTTGVAILAVEAFLQGRRVLYAAPTGLVLASGSLRQPSTNPSAAAGVQADPGPA